MTEDSSRTTQLRKQLETAQDKLKADPYPGTENKVKELKEKVAAAERNDEIHAERVAELAKEEQAKTNAHQAAEQAKIETQLRQQYNRALPKPVTDDEWELVRESVLHRYRLQQMDRQDELVKQTASRYRL